MKSLFGQAERLWIGLNLVLVDFSGAKVRVAEQSRIAEQISTRRPSLSIKGTQKRHSTAKKRRKYRRLRMTNRSNPCRLLHASPSIVFYSLRSAFLRPALNLAGSATTRRFVASAPFFCWSVFCLLFLNVWGTGGHDICTKSRLEAVPSAVIAVG